MGQIHERENTAMEQMVGSFLKNLNRSIESDYAAMAETVGKSGEEFSDTGRICRISEPVAERNDR